MFILRMKNYRLPSNTAMAVILYILYTGLSIVEVINRAFRDVGPNIWNPGIILYDSLYKIMILFMSRTKITTESKLEGFPFNVLNIIE